MGCGEEEEEEDEDEFTKSCRSASLSMKDRRSEERGVDDLVREEGMEEEDLESDDTVEEERESLRALVVVGVDIIVRSMVD